MLARCWLKESFINRYSQDPKSYAGMHNGYIIFRMEKKQRRQLTLFADKNEAREIELVRRLFNPEQQALIDCHVTLCREDEIEDLDTITGNLQQLLLLPARIGFGPVTRFENGRGVMLPGSGVNEPFHLLRSKILAGIPGITRKPDPHITLLHPRNSSCTDNIFQRIRVMHFPASLEFDTISLVEQNNGGRWQVLEQYKLTDNRQ